MRELIKLGKAYADNTPHEKMKEERFNGIASQHREMTVEETLNIFEGLLRGENKEWCIRAKIDHTNKNKCLRDPVFYRYKDEPHYRFGNKYKAYPNYDFATPIVDSLELISHCMRTNEYADRHHLYDWLLTTLNIHNPIMHDFSRLSFKNTVLSKRKLNLLVDNKIVDGWDDPRMPTIRGVINRGILKEAIIDYIQQQGHSKNTTLQEWDKLYAINKQYIDPVAPRFTGIFKDSAVLVKINNFNFDKISKLVQLHPKDKSIGNKELLFSNKILMEKEDLLNCKEGEKITLMKWGNAKVISLKDNQYELELLPNDKDFKSTQKFTWLANVDNLCEVEIIEYDHLLNRADAIDYEGEFMDIVNKQSMFVSLALLEPGVRLLNKNQHIQIERRGF